MPNNNPANAALEQLQKALDSGLTQLGSLRGDLSTSGRQQLRDLEKRIRELRKDLDKNGRKLLKELEDRVAAASGGRVGSTSRSRSTTARRKPATAARRKPA